MASNYYPTTTTHTLQPVCAADKRSGFKWKHYKKFMIQTHALAVTFPDPPVTKQAEIPVLNTHEVTAS